MQIQFIRSPFSTAIDIWAYSDGSNVGLSLTGTYSIIPFAYDSLLEYNTGNRYTFSGNGFWNGSGVTYSIPLFFNDSYNQYVTGSGFYGTVFTGTLLYSGNPSSSPFQSRITGTIYDPTLYLYDQINEYPSGYYFGNSLTGNLFHQTGHNFRNTTTGVVSNFIYQIWDTFSEYPTGNTNTLTGFNALVLDSLSHITGYTDGSYIYSESGISGYTTGLNLAPTATFIINMGFSQWTELGFGFAFKIPYFELSPALNDDYFVSGVTNRFECGISGSITTITDVIPTNFNYISYYNNNVNQMVFQQLTGSLGYNMRSAFAIRQDIQVGFTGVYVPFAPRMNDGIFGFGDYRYFLMRFSKSGALGVGNTFKITSSVSLYSGSDRNSYTPSLNDLSYQLDNFYTNPTNSDSIFTTDLLAENYNNIMIRNAFPFSGIRISPMLIKKYA